MSFKTTLTAASIALLGSAAVLAMPTPSEAKDGCGRAYRFSYSQQRCVRRTDASPRVAPRVVYQPAVVHPIVRPVIRPVIQLSF